MLKAIWECVHGSGDGHHQAVTTTSQWKEAEKSHDFEDPRDANLADKIIDAMHNADKTGEELRTRVSGFVNVKNWTESLAKAVLARLDDGVRKGTMGRKGPLKEAFDKAVAAAVGFAKEHPVWATLIALGILAVLLPWAIEALGFGELGPVEGMPQYCNAICDWRRLLTTDFWQAPLRRGGRRGMQGMCLWEACSPSCSDWE